MHRECPNGRKAGQATTNLNPCSNYPPACGDDHSRLSALNPSGTRHGSRPLQPSRVSLLLSVAGAITFPRSLISLIARHPIGLLSSALFTRPNIGRSSVLSPNRQEFDPRSAVHEASEVWSVCLRLNCLWRLSPRV